MFRGVSQRSPLSPNIYNFAQKIILKEISDQNAAAYQGYQIRDDLENIITMSLGDNV